MTAEQLLIKRVKVENKWPGCPFEVGDILYNHKTPESGFGKDSWYSLSKEPMAANTRVYLPGDVEPFPYLMRPIQWFEDRAESEMPEYVKCRLSCAIDTDKFQKDAVYKTSEVKDKSCLNWFYVATEQEYITYINSKNNVNTARI